MAKQVTRQQRSKPYTKTPWCDPIQITPESCEIHKIQQSEILTSSPTHHHQGAVSGSIVLSQRREVPSSLYGLQNAEFSSFRTSSANNSCALPAYTQTVGFRTDFPSLEICVRDNFVVGVMEPLRVDSLIQLFTTVLTKTQILTSAVCTGRMRQFGCQWEPPNSIICFSIQPPFGQHDKIMGSSRKIFEASVLSKNNLCAAWNYLPWQQRSMWEIASSFLAHDMYF